MTETPTGAVLRKRVSPPRPVRGASESQVESILEVEMPRGADRLLALEVAVQAITQVLPLQLLQAPGHDPPGGVGSDPHTTWPPARLDALDERGRRDGMALQQDPK